MLWKVAAFEWRYQLRSPVFWVVSVVFVLLCFGIVASDNIRLDAGSSAVNANSPQSLGLMHLFMSMFFMFVTTAFVANVVIRDEETKYGPIIRTTRLSRFDYLVGRFIGAFAISCIAFLAVPLGAFLGTLAPWIDPETLGPNNPAHYAYAFFLLGLPNVLLTAALFFAVATVTRSMMWSYVAAVAFLVIYSVVLTLVDGIPGSRDTIAAFELFGVNAFQRATDYATVAELNGSMPPFEGRLLFNRIFVIALALLAIVFAVWRFDFVARSVSTRKQRKLEKRAARLAAVEPERAEVLPAPRPGKARWVQFVTQFRLEAAQILRSPAFLVLMLLGMTNALAAMFFANDLYGTPVRPATFSLLTTLLGAFAIIPIIIAGFYAGELIWRDRDRKMNEIIDSTALPDWAFIVPKMLAVAMVLLVSIALSVVAALIVQVSRGFTDIRFDEYLGWYLLPMAIDVTIFAVIAVFLQALSPNKYIGWGLLLLYFVANLVLRNLGLAHPLYLRGPIDPGTLSDMNGAALTAARSWSLRLYWAAAAVVLALLAHLLWRRGTQVSLSARFRRIPARLGGATGVIGGIALVTMIATGIYVYRNTNVLNEYRAPDQVDEQLADYEKKFGKYVGVAQPRVRSVELTVDLYPSEKRMEARGEYVVENDTGKPVRDLHVRFADPEIEVIDVSIQGAKPVLTDDDFNYRIYRLEKPMAAGEQRRIGFHTRRWQRGFRAEGNDSRMVRNGTFLNSSEIAPVLGMDRDAFLIDPVKRRRYELPEQERLPKLENVAAANRNYVGNASWVTTDITVSTEADQVPIAPGRKVSDETARGRRTARFVLDRPILNFFSVQSARYAVAEGKAGDIDLAVYYHPTHDYNVPTMLKAMKESLAYYQEAFTPYQFDYLRIVEFPDYAQFAQAFAGTVPYSEGLGFIADNRDPDKIDYVTYVTAHEIGHQWWAHQIIGPEMQGGTVWVETMAQYSALMVMKRIYGEEKIRRFLKYELDNYLSSRGSELIEEVPLIRVENQPYIHYRKGSLVMYLLQDRLGEDRVNEMLRGLLDRYAFQGPPYPRSTELLDGFKSLARNEEERRLVSDLLEKITIYDLKAKEAVTKKRADGRWETSFTVETAKFYADGEGNEKPAKITESFDIGLFAARPGYGAFDKDDVIAFERKQVKPGTARLTLVSKKKPAFVGIDPYNYFIDRDSDDNVIAVTEKR